MTTPITGTDPGSYVAVVTAPVPNAPARAEDVQIVAQGLANQTQHLNHVVTDGTYTITCATVAATTVNAGAVTVSASFDQTSGVAAFHSGVTLVAQAGSVTSIQGRNRRRSRVQLTSAPHSVGPADGLCFELAPNVGAVHIITLLSVTGQTALDGELLEFIIPDMSVCNTGTTWDFQRESGVSVATVRTISGQSGSVTIQFEFVATVWRLGMNSGFQQGTGGAAVYGVSPGAGA